VGAFHWWHPISSAYPTPSLMSSRDLKANYARAWKTPSLMNYATSILWYLDSLTLTKLFVKMLKFFKNNFFTRGKFCEGK
jgi:hypothetical protein